MSYCASRFHTIRRPTPEVKIGAVGVGGANPIRLQSMTTSDTQDIDATVRQSIALAEVGCEIVRITAPNVAAARCLREIRARLTAAGFGAIPLVADIHFLPSAAMEAVEHVEKIRVNPGNYADKKKFVVREYSDADYDAELARLHDAFSPLVKRCRELGRALRIGTNHGSLSDRIMNRYGDTPLGMVESALEFLRIAESHSYRDIILSMKSSNPKVMIQAYRLLVQRMAQENMHYPLHLGVTEAGDGEDGRIKGAIGIGSLLLDGLGDTIRVSLTEDSVYEIPVARAIAGKAMAAWARPVERPGFDAVDPFGFNRRLTESVTLTGPISCGGDQVPRVMVRPGPAAGLPAMLPWIGSNELQDTPVEGVLLPIETAADLAGLPPLPCAYVLEPGPPIAVADLRTHASAIPAGTVLLQSFGAADAARLAEMRRLVQEQDWVLAAMVAPDDLDPLAGVLRDPGESRLIFTLDRVPAGAGHAIGGYRLLADALRRHELRAPIWIRNTAHTALQADPDFLSKLLEASILTGSLLCDGIGDLVSIETEVDARRSVRLSYNVLQGAGARISKTEFVACPSCGRTLFDLQTTTQRIRAQTGHLKGVKLAIMGCIVNGPGEMADADFGYVGGAPGKINLYVGRNCVEYNIPATEADSRLIGLIKAHGKWIEPEPASG